MNRALVGILIAAICAAIVVVAVQSFHHASHVLAPGKPLANATVLAPHKPVQKPVPPKPKAVVPPAPVHAPAAPQPSPEPNAAPVPNNDIPNNKEPMNTPGYDNGPPTSGPYSSNNGAPSEGCGTPAQCLNQ